MTSFNEQAQEEMWERVWSSESQDDGAQTAHVTAFDDESFCEACDSAVVYSGADDRHGSCNCD